MRYEHPPGTPPPVIEIWVLFGVPNVEGELTLATGATSFVCHMRVAWCGRQAGDGTKAPDSRECEPAASGQQSRVRKG